MSTGPQDQKQRRLTETDIDPGGDASSGNSGQTEDTGTRRVDNQPTENREDPSRGRDTGNRDSENAPNAGHGE